ncbi:MAG: hypothetical protein ACHREM_03735 [Polyangiales bacterium]
MALHRTHRATLAVALLAGAASCGAQASPAVPAQNLGAAQPIGVAWATMSASVRDDNRSELRALLLETQAVVRSDRFRLHLLQFAGDDALRTSMTGALTDGRAVLTHYLGGARLGLARPVIVYDDCPAGSTILAVTGTHPGLTRVEMHLTQVVLDSWRAADPRRRSCAINLVAHELSHTVYDDADPKAPRMLYRDDDHASRWRWGGRQHLVSYTIGTVAQCSWLEASYAEPFDACVERMGTRSFTWNGCD